jgi:hypothetical protein
MSSAWKAIVEDGHVLILTRCFGNNLPTPVQSSWIFYKPTGFQKYEI